MKNCTAVRVRGSGFDDYGDPIAGTARFTIPDCSKAPRTSSDITDRGRHGVVVGLDLYCPPGHLLPSDQVEVDGVLYDIEGEPGDWHSPYTGWHPGEVVALRRAAG